MIVGRRAYRDAIKSPWKKFFSSNESEVVLGNSTHSEDELKAMKTLAVLDAERVASQHLASLPAVSVPAFKTDLELFAFLHKTLREGNAKKTEAVLRRVLAPSYLLEGSDVLLDSIGEDLVRTTLKDAYGGKMTYAEQFAPDLPVAAYQPNRLSFANADGRHTSTFWAVLAGGTYQNGVKVSQSYKIHILELGVVKDADEVARLRSMLPATRFAAPQGTQLFSSLGGQVAAQQQAEAQAQVVQAMQWTPFTSTNARLKISFPAKPTETQGQMNEKYPMWTVEATNDQVLCRAVAVIYPTRLNRMQAQTTVQSALQSLADSNGATLGDSSDLNEGTFGRMTTLQKEGAVMKARVFVVNDVLYQLILSGSPTTMRNLSEREFLGSFQVAK